MLPPVVHLWKESDRAALRWAVERMAQELRERPPGNDLVVQQLAHMMLVQALRLYLSDDPGGHVALHLRVEVQAQGRHAADGIPDPLAHAAGCG